MKNGSKPLSEVVRSTSLPRAGIIPACAGSTKVVNVQHWNLRNHPRMCGEHPRSLGAQARTGGITPRMCGEHLRRATMTTKVMGSSPHVWGAHGIQRYTCRFAGIIPACAGSTKTGPCSTCGAGDHPRMCGEHRRRHGRAGRRRGIIPACAGSTRRLQVHADRGRDHPRMCGEHLA